MQPKRDKFFNRKVRLLDMLSKIPEDKLEELEEFLYKLLGLKKQKGGEVL